MPSLRSEQIAGHQPVGQIRLVCACGRVTHVNGRFERVRHTLCCGLHPTLPSVGVHHVPPPPTECIDCGVPIVREFNRLYCEPCGVVRRAETQQRYKTKRILEREHGRDECRVMRAV